MIARTKRKTPAGNQGLSNASNANPSLPDAAEGLDPTGLVAGVYVAVVQIRGEHVPPRYRRRVFFNLPSAQRAIDRATMKGLDASIVLCQLIPAGDK